MAAEGVMASFMSDVRGLNGGGGRSDEARAMLGDMANPHAVAPSGANPSGKSSMDRLNDAAAKITQDAAERNARADFEAQVEEEVAYQEALAAASVKHIQIDDEKEDKGEVDEDFDDDPEVQSLQEKRLAALKARFAAEKAQQAQGHGEYREVVEEDFLKEVRLARAIAPAQPPPPPPPPNARSRTSGALGRRRCAAHCTWSSTSRIPSSSAAASPTSTCACSPISTAAASSFISTPRRRRSS